MKKLILKTFIITALSIAVIACLSAISASAESYTNSKGSATVVCGKYKKKFTAKKYKKNFSAALNAALDMARKKSTSKKPATVTVEPGYYQLDRTLKIYSDTILSAEGCTFRLYGNLLRNGYNKKASSASGYNGAKNITIQGGTWDAMVPYSQAGTLNWRIQHSTMRFGHMKNLTVTGCSFVGNYNCHDIEIAGVYNAKITKNSFTNENPVNNFPNDGGRESIQIDCCTAEAMPEFVSFDNTACEKITISYNSFKNKFRGIGSHHAVLGRPFDSIKVHHNTFESIGGIAVYGVYWTNSNIYSNTMKDVGLGIDIRSMTTGAGYNFYNLDHKTYEQCDEIMRKSKLYIHTNTISLRKEDNNYTRACGIRVLGEYYENDDLITGTMAGTYKLYNVSVGINSKGQVKPNIISGNVSVGVHLNFCVDSVISENKIDLSEAVSDSANAIEVKTCENVSVTNNELKNGPVEASKGIYLTSAGTYKIFGDNVSVKNNTIDNFTNSGIYVQRQNNAVIETNTVSNCSEAGIAVRESVGAGVRENTLSDNKTYGTYTFSKAEDTLFEKNTVSGSSYGYAVKGSDRTTFSENDAKLCSTAGYYAFSSADETVIKNNTVSECPTGIRLGAAVDTKVESNDIRDCSMRGFDIAKSKYSVIKDNNIKDCTSYGFYVETGADGNTIESNTINGSATGFYVTKSLNTTIRSNTVEECTIQGAYVLENAENTAFEENTITGAPIGVYLRESSGNSLIKNNLTSCRDHGVIIRQCSGNLLDGNTIECNSYGVRLNYGADKTVMKNNTITSGTVEPVYYVGTSDPTISVEKSFELYDNVLNPPKKYNALKLTNSTVAARCYSNFNSSGTASKYKIKGESDASYTTLSQPDTLDSFTLDNHEGESVDLSFSCSVPNIMYRVTRISGDEETLLIDTPGQLYTDSKPVTNGEDVIYKVCPYRLFTRIKFLGTPIEIRTFSILVTEPPTEPPTEAPTEPETEAPTETSTDPSETAPESTAPTETE